MKTNGIPSLLVFSLIAFLLSCNSKAETIVIATKPPTENLILSNIQLHLIDTYTDYKVVLKDPIAGGTSNIHPVLVKGEVDLYTEYTGTAYHFVLNYEEQVDEEMMYGKIQRDYKRKYELSWLGRYGFNNTFGLAVKRRKARELGITSYSDLARISPTLRFGAEPDFYERDDGFKGLREKYGFAFKDRKEIVVGLKYLAIDNSEVDVINIFTTDGSISKYDLIVLEDDLGYFPSYFAATVIRDETLENYPGIEEALGKMEGMIDSEEMSWLNYRVEVEHEDPGAVAKSFVSERLQ